MSLLITGFVIFAVLGGIVGILSASKNKFTNVIGKILDKSIGFIIFIGAAILITVFIYLWANPGVYESYIN